jgi:adhesin/invasin
VGTVHFSSSDGTATLPKNYTFTAADAGVHTFTSAFILKKRGTQTITVADIVNSALTASDDITVS